MRSVSAKVKNWQMAQRTMQVETIRQPPLLNLSEPRGISCRIFAGKQHWQPELISLAKIRRVTRHVAQVETMSRS